MKNPNDEHTASFHIGALVRPTGHPCKGFTLLEVMVAMLLLAVIMTTSVTMLFVNLKGWEGLTEHSDEVMHGHLIEKRVASMIQHMAPLVWRDQKQRLLAMHGQGQRFQFISKAPRQHRDGGLFEYLLVQELTNDQANDQANNQRVSLVLYLTPFDPNTNQLTLPGSADGRVLVSGLQSVEFSYFGSKQDREHAQWHDDWEAGSTQYPDLVRLRLTTDEERVKERYIQIRQNYPMILQRP